MLLTAQFNSFWYRFIVLDCMRDALLILWAKLQQQQAVGPRVLRKTEIHQGPERRSHDIEVRSVKQ